MTKKLIAALSIAGVLALGGGAFAVGTAMNQKATADMDYKAANGILDELKVGKYYLENGTEDEYVEVYDDGTIQVFNLNYFKLLCDLNSERVASMNETELQEYKELNRESWEFWDNRNYYYLSEIGRVILIESEPITSETMFSGSCFTYPDENTLVWNDEHIYKFAE